MKNFLNTPAGSWVKVFIAGILGAVLANIAKGNDIFNMDWKTIVSGAIASVLPVIINWFNPTDQRYGKQ